AIFGGLVALGYSSDEIISLLQQVDWDRLQSDEIPRDRLSYADKKQRERYAFGLAIKDWKLQLPKGMNSGHFVLKNLDYLFQQANSIDNFEDFPIPFFCLATDLTAGAPHVFEDGNLSLALRASSAFPSIFFPFEVNDKLFVDGGVIDNFPVSLMREKPVDIVIGVDVQSPSYSKEELNNAFRVLEQISTFTNKHNNEYSDSLVDIVIRPELGNTGLFDFENSVQLVALGYREAEMHRERFREIAAQQRARDNSEVLPLPADKMYVRSVEVHGNSQRTAKFFARDLKIKQEGVLNISRLNRMLDEWKGSKHFEQIHHVLEPDTIRSLSEDGLPAFHLKLYVDDSDIKTMVNVGIRYDDDFGAGLMLNFNRRNLFMENAHFNIDFVASENPRTWIEYSTNMGVIPSLGVRFRAHRYRSNLYQENLNLGNIRYSDQSLDVFLRSTWWEIYAIGVGVQLERSSWTNISTPVFMETWGGSFINYYVFTDLDTYDREFKPTKGIRISGMMRSIAQRVKFEQFFEPSVVINGKVSQAISWKKRIGLEWWSQTALTLGQNLNPTYNVFLGGLGENYINYNLPFLGYRFMELQGSNVITAGVNLFMELGKNQFFTLKANWGKIESSFEELVISEQILDGYGISYGFQTPIGPLELNVTTSSNHWQLYTYFTLGYWF
ncbi:MAG: patatin-like phospholipase family protein, partial [Cryomorphaceae bacterium]|nr:patatin-like phospholipase family protein [Cryomorphaceae bacterium]